MKEVYYIGRDVSSDIVLCDDTNIISRTHAILRIGKGGKCTISDQSLNGTYVNGIRLTSNVEVPVSRTDIISFAHLIDLDWDMIPDVARMRRKRIIWGLVVLVFLAVVGYGAFEFMKYKKTRSTGEEVLTQIDSLKNTPTDTLEKETNLKPDAKKANASPKVTKKVKETPKQGSVTAPEKPEVPTNNTTKAEPEENVNPIF